ncbi:MAG: FAD-binding oxidoreductase [Thermoanaerobaculia bacterium]
MRADASTLARKLSSLVGEEYVLTGPAAARFAVDEVAPALAVRPGSQEQVGWVAAACSAAGASMLPWTDGALIGLGNPPSRLDVVVCLDRLTRIVEFDDANLNVSVEAGVRLDALQAVLTAKGEFLPLDPAQSDQVTVGGLVHTNASGPSRQLYGSLRDWVLGLRVVLPGGERIRCGGKVIKNVSGYDMNKIFIGNLGTLGIITEATFKLLPAPKMRATVLGVFAKLSEVSAVVGRALESFLLPEALEALDPQTLATLGPALGMESLTGYGLAVSMAGSRETVERQVRDFRALFAECMALKVETVAAERADAAWREIRDVQAKLPPGRVIAKIAVPIGKTLDLLGAVEGLMRRHEWRGAVTAHAGSGIVRAGIEVGAGSALEPLREALLSLRREAESLDGSLVIEMAPISLKRSLDTWGRVREGFSVMRRLKAEFDPGALLTTGRFLGGI